MARDGRLQRYEEKRDFRRTAEPRGDGKRLGPEPRFVVQLHDARRLHYDFRIEVDGVLKSWAVPRGPSTDPQDKRLAVPTEDHPLDYEDFEGVIPGGEYGAGAVLVWDVGTYRNDTRHKGKPVPAGEAVERGHIRIWLEGEKLRGGYALTRTGIRGDWLLVKTRDEEADTGDPVSSRPESVKTGRTLDDIAAEG